jgi:hypothetical protein
LHFFIAKPNDAIAVLLQFLGACLILLFLAFMRAAIQFHRQPAGRTPKI